MPDSFDTQTVNQTCHEHLFSNIWIVIQFLHYWICRILW